MCKEHYEINENIYEAIREMNFDNIHLVGKNIYDEKGKELAEALINELEANIMFSKNKGDNNGKPRSN